MNQTTTVGTAGGEECGVCVCTCIHVHCTCVQSSLQKLEAGGGCN